MKLICPNCGGSASVPMEMAGYCRDHRPRLVPERIQLRRTKGWRKPEGAVVVARPSRWGNPFTMADAIEWGFADDRRGAQRLVVECFRSVLTHGSASSWWFQNGAERIEWMQAHLGELRGRDLACWCPLDQPCHADVLLELANTEATR